MSPSDEVLSRALALRADGDLHGAIELLRSAAGEDLADTRLAVNLAKMLAESGQLERAEPWFRHALKLAPDDLDLRLAFGTFLGQAGHAADAREHLQLVMHDLEAALDQASILGDVAAIGEVNRFLGATSVNLGRAALECGDAAMAIAFARAWLSDAEHGDAARELIADALDSEELDPHHLAELSLADGRVTPDVVKLLVERALGEDPPDLPAVERALAAADAVLPANWYLADETLAHALGAARAHLGRGVMRGDLDARDFPMLLDVHRL